MVHTTQRVVEQRPRRLVVLLSLADTMKWPPLIQPRWYGHDFVALVLMSVRVCANVGPLARCGSPTPSESSPCPFRARTAHALAVDGQGLASQARAQWLHPDDEARLEGRPIQQREHPVEGVVRGDAMLERQEAPEPAEFDLPPLGHTDPVLGPADHAGKGHQQQTFQRVAAASAARVVEFGKRRQIAQGGGQVCRSGEGSMANGQSSLLWHLFRDWPHAIALGQCPTRLDGAPRRHQRR